MIDALKLYLLGLFIGVSGGADQNREKITEAQSEPPAIVAKAPAHKTYSTCLLSAKKEYSTCTTKLDKSIKSHTRSAHTIFQKQRECEMKREKSLSTCKIVFLR